MVRLMPAPRNNPKAFADWYELDYFRRPRSRHVTAWVVVLTMAACAAAVAATFAWPGGRTAYQAGPLSDAHAFLADNCAACHTEAFSTARRLLPANQAARATPDAACLQCHDAGVHNPHQTQFVGADGQAADCAACHREHRGDVKLARIDDSHCVDCHASLATDDGRHRFAAAVSHFATDHPPFGAWRGGSLTDPGTLKFNHKVHLELADKLKGVPAARLGDMADHLRRLTEQSCTYCHQPDGERRYILPVRYENHCAGCHPLTAQPVGDGPAEAARGWDARLPHPQSGETAAVVRGALLERYWKLIAAATPPPADAPGRPPVLQRGLPPLPADQRERVRQLARQTEDRLFTPDGGDVLPGLERPLFRPKGGCAYCHTETTKPDARPDGLPAYAPPRLRDRWAGVTFPDERFGPANGERRSASEQAARDRWFPFARFSHDSHRMLECTACHDAANSTQTSDVLMPAIDTCRQCHNRTATGVRSDCLECHQYHDRAAEPHGLRGRQTVGQALRGARGP
jgi:predicted CXXCH cytochrome family protein